MAEIRYYVDADGSAPFADWTRELDDIAAFKVSGALTRMAAGNLSNAKGVGASFSAGPDTAVLSLSSGEIRLRQTECLRVGRAPSLVEPCVAKHQT